MCEGDVGWVTGAPGLIAVVRSAKQFPPYVLSRSGDSFVFCRALEEAVGRLKSLAG